MSDITLGTLITGEAKRDAIHFAIAPVCSDEILMPGAHVVLVKGSTTKVESLTLGQIPIGIVDPFLTKPIPAGSKFWLMLYQKTVTGMRHAWEHPAFVIKEEELPAAGMKFPDGYASERWLRNFCNLGDHPGFDAVMEKAIEIADGGSGCGWDDEYMHFDGLDAHGEIPDEFWVHVERYLGRPIKGHKAKAFSCSC